MFPTMKDIERVAKHPLDPRIIGWLQSNGYGPDLAYISETAMQVLMNDAFGGYQSIEYSEPVVRQYRTYKVKNKKTGQFVDYTPKETVEVKCTITVPVWDEDTKQVTYITREGFGSATMENRSDEDKVAKSAQSDAMKKAAYSWGFAHELRVNSEGKKKSIPHESEWFQEHVFGVWDKNNQEKYTKELQLISAYMKAKGLTNPNALAQEVTGDPDALFTTHNVHEICTKIKKEQQKESV